jgi:hypothetical protein
MRSPKAPALGGHSRTLAQLTFLARGGSVSEPPPFA